MPNIDISGNMTTTEYLNEVVKELILKINWVDLLNGSGNLFIDWLAVDMI
jgi:hypothetical protein